MNAFIKSSFWTDDRIELLPPEQKLSLLWLITNQGRDIAGFVTKTSPRRFELDTGIKIEDLERACQALPESFQALPDGSFFCTNFVRHNYGRHGKISNGNKIIIAVLRHVEALTSEQQALFFRAYPELAKEENHDAAAALQNKPLASPCQGLREGQGRAGQDKDSLVVDHEELSKMVDSLVQAYPRKTHYAETLKAAKTCLLRHTAEFRSVQGSYERVLAGTKAIASAIAQWTQAEQIKYVKPPHLFFEGDHWKDDPKFWISHKVLPSEELPSLGGRQPSTKFTV